MPGRALAALALLALVALLAACQSAPTPGASCSLTSDCASPLICRLARCRTECVTSRDCPAGARCLLDGSHIGSCSVEADERCESGGRACPTGLTCVGDRCANTCVTDADCAAGDLCRDAAGTGLRFCFSPDRDDAGAPVDAFTADAPPVDATSTPDAPPIDAGPAGSGEDCANAILLVPNASGDAVATATLGAFHFDYDTYCNDAAQLGRDVVYAIDVPGGADVEITTSPSSAATVVAVAGATCGAFHDVCSGAQSSALLNARVLLHRTPAPGRFYFEVQGATQAVVDTITVHVHVSPASAVGCAAPLDLGAGATMLAWTDGDTGAPSTMPDCAGWTAGNVDVLDLGVLATSFNHISAFSRDFPIVVATTTGNACAPTVTGAACGMVTADMPGYHYSALVPASAPARLVVGGIPRGDASWVGQYIITVAP